MTHIKPISDLRNHADEISAICHKERAPVFITKNGAADMVVMSQAYYDQQQALLGLYRKLDEAERNAKRSRGISHMQMLKELKAKVV